MSFKIESIYDSGTASILEDRLLINPPFYGVLDGVSGLYYPDKGPILFGGFSGGQRVVQIVSTIFSDASRKDSLKEILMRANDLIRKFVYENGIDIKSGDLLPGAEFALAKVTDNEIEVIQGGDSFAVWRTKKGKIFSTPNQNYLYETSLIKVMADILLKYKGNRNAAWNEYLPILSSMKRRMSGGANPNGCIALNGQKAIAKLWNRYILVKDDVNLLLLFTDGLVKLEETKNTQEMGERIVRTYSKAGWGGVLARIRRWESAKKSMSYIDHAEATGVAVHLD